jgi:cytochrome c5
MPRRLLACLALLLAGVTSAQDVLPESALPDYERDVDHAALIRGWNEAARRRGQEIFTLVCQTCHGDENLPGSMPTALRFTTGQFQHGSDPLTMYRTLTRGWRQMPPQVQLVPQEKYDVIHYIRETLLAPHNPTQRFAVTPAYLASLPPGTTRGPAPVKREPWRDMDYGPFLHGTFEVADAANRAAAALLKDHAARDAALLRANVAYKGIAIRVDGPGGVAAGSAWTLFEHDTLRVAGAWTGAGFIDWDSILFNGRHVVHPRTAGAPAFETADGPGWADPRTGRFDDVRIAGRDGRRFGPFPHAWMQYRGLHRHGDRVVLSYTVGDAAILESHDFERVGDAPLFVRTLNVGRSPHDLALRVANAGAAVAVSGLPPSALAADGRFVTLRIPAAATPVRLALRIGRADTGGLAEAARAAPPPRDLAPYLNGGPAAWPETLTTAVVRSGNDGAFAWERIDLPVANPWRTRLRPTGIDFLPGGKQAVVCTWDGDVWHLEGIDSPAQTVGWRRIAAGLFQPLGIKVRNGEIFVTCRDQLVVLRDRNGDGETDFYQTFNSDHQVTEHFHEFAMGLQTDAAGNFYYAKSARHARTALVPQHGTLLRIAADGTRTDILAYGFRAANGVCLNPDGSFFVTDQEGHWMPKNRINHVPATGGFFGNMFGYHDVTDVSDDAMLPPLAWITNAKDRSPAELLWVPPDRWGPLAGALLHLSYGNGRLFLVPHESVGGRTQGGLIELPLPAFPTGVMRGRFHPRSGDLFLAGMTAWATNQPVSGGLYRVRPTGRPMGLPRTVQARADGLALTFTEPLDPAAVTPAAFTYATWTLRRSEKYGSQHHDERTPAITGVRLLDERTVLVTPAGFSPTQCYRIGYTLRLRNGTEIAGSMDGTLHGLAK